MKALVNNCPLEVGVQNIVFVEPSIDETTLQTLQIIHLSQSTLTRIKFIKTQRMEKKSMKFGNNISWSFGNQKLRGLALMCTRKNLVDTLAESLGDESKRVKLKG